MKKRNIIILVIAGIAAAGGITYGVIRNNNSSAANDNAVYVQKVSTLMPGGAGSFSQRLSGVAESQDTVDIKADVSKKIVEVYVTQGASVNKDDPLFVYDVTDAQSNIQSTQLDIEGLNNDITAANNAIADLTQQRDAASDDMKLQYTTEIQDKQMQIRQDQLDIQGKQNTLQKYQQEVDSATVKAPISGVIKTVNANGGVDNNTGQELPIVSIAETGTIRIKGTVTEQNISQVTAGMPVTIRSRMDETQTWTGTVTSVETDPQSSSSNSYYSSDSSGESASKYTFYVAMENSDGLMLGQHVFIEPGETSTKTGIWIDTSFIVQNEDGTSYVWAADNNKLVKKTVETGTVDDEDYTTEITSGLSEDDEIAYPDSSFTEGLPVISMESAS